MRRIVVVPLIGPCLDADATSEQALPLARTIVERTDATIVLVSVIDVLAELGGLPESTLMSPKTLDGHVAAREAYLAGIAQTFPDHQVHTIVRVGEPSEELLAVLTMLEDPLLVMASHGRTGIRRLIMGSVAFDCVRHGQCPVVVVPVQSAFEPVVRAPLERVLIPIDGSSPAECVLEAALDALGPPNLHLHLVHVIEPMPRLSGGSLHQYDEITQHLANQYLEQLAARLILDGYRVTWEVCGGDPEQEIARIAGEQGTNLIAMATHGRSGLGRLLLGSVTEQVGALARVPLLIVKPSPEAVATVRRATQAGRRSFQRTDDAASRIPPTPVRDIMVQPVITMGVDAPLAAIARTMLEHQIGAVPIVDTTGQLVGIVTESTLTSDDQRRGSSRYDRLTLFGQAMELEGIERIYAAGRALTARQVMTSPVVTATEDEALTQVVARMVTHDINRVPVVRDGRPVGIVARHDLLKVLAQHAEDESRESDE